MRFTQSQISEPAKFINKLERRVAVLEKIDDSKKRLDFAKQRQVQKQRDLQMRVRKQNLLHQR